MIAEDQASLEGDRDQGRFVKGKSGNARGRPRKSAGGFEEALRKAGNDKVSVSEGGRRKMMRKLDIAATQVANKGAAGDLQALRLMARAAGGPPESQPEGERGITKAIDLEIVARLVARIRATTEEDR